jgi:hypothetical protein
VLFERQGFADKLKRFSDMMDETRLVMTILQFARSGHATDVMVEQAIALADRHVVVAKSEGDESLLKTALDLKSGLESKNRWRVRECRSVIKSGVNADALGALSTFSMSRPTS